MIDCFCGALDTHTHTHKWQRSYCKVIAAASSHTRNLDDLFFCFSVLDSCRCGQFRCFFLLFFFRCRSFRPSIWFYDLYIACHKNILSAPVNKLMWYERKRFINLKFSNLTIYREEFCYCWRFCLSSSKFDEVNFYFFCWREWLIRPMGPLAHLGGETGVNNCVALWQWMWLNW